jgi:hypothetical protein
MRRLVVGVPLRQHRLPETITTNTMKHAVHDERDLDGDADDAKKRKRSADRNYRGSRSIKLAYNSPLCYPLFLTPSCLHPTFVSIASADCGATPTMPRVRSLLTALGNGTFSNLDETVINPCFVLAPL